MFKWAVTAWDSFYLMTPMYILLFIPPGSPFTDMSTQAEHKLKNTAGLAVHMENVDDTSREKIIEDIPIYCFNARYEDSFPISKS